MILYAGTTRRHVSDRASAGLLGVFRNHKRTNTGLSSPGHISGDACDVLTGLQREAFASANRHRKRSLWGAGCRDRHDLRLSAQRLRGKRTICTEQSRTRVIRKLEARKERIDGAEVSARGLDVDVNRAKRSLRASRSVDETETDASIRGSLEAVAEQHGLRSTGANGTGDDHGVLRIFLQILCVDVERTSDDVAILIANVNRGTHADGDVEVVGDERNGILLCSLKRDVTGHFLIVEENINRPSIGGGVDEANLRRRRIATVIIAVIVRVTRHQRHRQKHGKKYREYVFHRSDHPVEKCIE